MRASRLAGRKRNEKRSAAADWVSRLPDKAKTGGRSPRMVRGRHRLEPTSSLHQAERSLGQGDRCRGGRLDRARAAQAGRGLVLLEGDGKALVLEKSIGGEERILVIANGSFLLNEAVVNPARRPLAERVLEWADRRAKQVALVEGSFVLGGADGDADALGPTAAAPALRWVAIQVGLAALLAALARAARLGRPRPDPPSGADRPAEHAVALGALLARAEAAQEAHELLDRYRRWRYPRTSRVGERCRPSRSGAPPGESTACGDFLPLKLEFQSEGDS